MAIKKLQNNFTTPEQSKRLLKLGVPADSADCGIVEDIMHGGRERDTNSSLLEVVQRVRRYIFPLLDTWQDYRD